MSTSFLRRDSSNLVVKRSLTLSIIYLNFLLFFRSRVPLIFQSGTLLIPKSNSDATLAFSTREDHVIYTRDAYSQFELRRASFAILDARPSRDLHLTCSSHMTSFQAQLHKPNKLVTFQSQELSLKCDQKWLHSLTHCLDQHKHWSAM